MKYAVMVGPMGTERTVRKAQVGRLEAEGYRVDRYVNMAVTGRAAQEKVDKGKWVEMETPDRTVINAPAEEVEEYEARGYKVVGQGKAPTEPKPRAKTLSSMNSAELRERAAKIPGLKVPKKITNKSLASLIREAEATASPAPADPSTGDPGTADPEDGTNGSQD